MQLGLIVLPSDHAELEKVLAALSKMGVAASNVSANTQAPAKPAAKETQAPAKKEALAPVTAEQVKTAMTKVRDELGEDTIAELLTAFGATKLKDVAKEDWSALVAAAESALGSAETNDDLDDDGFGDLDDDGFGDLDDDDDGDAPDAEAVKVAVQAYAKANGKEKATAILSKNGLNTVRGLATADAKVLSAIMKAVS